MSHVAGIPTQVWGTMQVMSLPTQTLRDASPNGLTPLMKNLSRKCCIDEKSPTIPRIMEGAFVIVSPSPNIGDVYLPRDRRPWGKIDTARCEIL